MYLCPPSPTLYQSGPKLSTYKAMLNLIAELSDHNILGRDRRHLGLPLDPHIAVLDVGDAPLHVQAAALQLAGERVPQRQRPLLHDGRARADVDAEKGGGRRVEAGLRAGGGQRQVAGREGAEEVGWGRGQGLADVAEGAAGARKGLAHGRRVARVHLS